MPRVFPILFFLSLLGCGGSLDGPSERELSRRFAVDLPAYWEMTEFKVEAAENIGSEVEPVHRARFRADVQLRFPTFGADHQEEDALIVKPLARAGEKRAIYGIATSVMNTGAWRTSFEFENDPLGAVGQPLESFQASRVVVRGSTEERALLEERRQRQVATDRARRDGLTSLVGQRLSGTATVSGGGSGFPVTVIVRSFNPVDDEVTGEITWPTLRGARKSFSGQLHGATLVVQEDQWLEQPADVSGILFGITYTLSVDPTGRLLSGTWQHPQRRGDLAF